MRPYQHLAIVVTASLVLLGASLSWIAPAPLRGAPLALTTTQTGTPQRVNLPLVAAEQPSPTATATVQATATATVTPTATQPAQQNCSPSYPTVCIPPPPPDLNCGDIPYRRFTVLPPDPHNFDTDKDGVGCEGG